jgi:hypothetical protein
MYEITRFSVLNLPNEDKAFVFETMIEDTAIITGKHIDVIVNEMARHYEVKERYITNCLKSIQSKFTDETNRIIGYIDGEPMKRTTYHMACKRIFEKLVKGFNGSDVFDPTNQNHTKFLTESTYSYLKCDKKATADV